MKSKLNERQKNQLQMLQRVFEDWIPPTPAFKTNHPKVPQGMIPYISCSDTHDYNYNIRVISFNDFISDNSYEKKENGQIIAQYDTLEDLVADGWELD